MVDVLSKRLEAMSEWFLLAGDEQRARLALFASRSMLDGPPQDQPFLQGVVRRDLDSTLDNLRRNLRLEDDNKEID